MKQRVLRKPRKTGRQGGQRRNVNAVKHGAYIDISTIDGRTRHARWKRERTESCIAHLGGNPSTAEGALIDRIVAKEWKCTQMEEAMARGDKVAAEHYISWANSLRLDLAQLGLARRQPPAMDLQAYLRQREKAESKLPTGGTLV